MYSKYSIVDLSRLQYTCCTGAAGRWSSRMASLPSRPRMHVAYPHSGTE